MHVEVSTSSLPFHEPPRSFFGERTFVDIFFLRANGEGLQALFLTCLLRILDRKPNDLRTRLSREGVKSVCELATTLLVSHPYYDSVLPA